MKRPSLAVQILIGLVLGVIVGAVFYGNPAVVSWLQPLGDIFIRLIKMIVVPIVLSTLIVGVAGVGDMKKLGKLGGHPLNRLHAVMHEEHLAFAQNFAANCCGHLFVATGPDERENRMPVFWRRRQR